MPRTSRHLAGLHPTLDNRQAGVKLPRATRLAPYLQVAGHRRGRLAELPAARGKAAR
jgi:hypothetical protein